MALKEIKTGTSKIASGQLSTLPSPLHVSFPAWMIEKYPELSATQTAINKFSQDVVQALSSLATTTYSSSQSDTVYTTASSDAQTDTETAIKEQVDQVANALSAIQDKLASLTERVSTITDTKSAVSSTIKEIKAQVDDVYKRLASVSASVPSVDGITKSISNLQDSLTQEAIAREQGDTKQVTGNDSGETVDVVGIAAAALSGHRAMTFGADGFVTYAQPGDVVAGVTEHAYEAGSLVAMRDAGLVVESSWTWTPGSTVFLAANGIITQAVPQSGYVTEIGKALSATSLLLQITESILIGQ